MRLSSSLAGKPARGGLGRSFAPGQRPTELRGVRIVEGRRKGALRESLFAEAQLGDQIAVALDILTLEIIEQ